MSLINNFKLFAMLVNCSGSRVGESLLDQAPGHNSQEFLMAASEANLQALSGPWDGGIMPKILEVTSKEVRYSTGRGSLKVTFDVQYGRVSRLEVLGERQTLPGERDFDGNVYVSGGYDSCDQWEKLIWDRVDAVLEQYAPEVASRC